MTPMINLGALAEQLRAQNQARAEQLAADAEQKARQQAPVMTGLPVQTPPQQPPLYLSDDGIGNALGTLGSSAVTGLVERPGVADPTHASLPHTDEPQIDPHSYQPPTMAGHQASALPHFARGGNLGRFIGKPVVVGEKGPEVVVPQSDATVLPSETSQRILKHLRNKMANLSIQGMFSQGMFGGNNGNTASQP